MGRYIYVADWQRKATKRCRRRTRRAAGDHRQRSAAACLSRTITKKHVARGPRIAGRLSPRSATCSMCRLRGEYLYAATGKGGFRVYDIANIDNKDFSERTITAPVSPLGQRFYVKTKYACRGRQPTTLAVDPAAHAQSGERRAEASTRCTPSSTSPTNTKAWSSSAIPTQKAKRPASSTLLDGDPREQFPEARAGLQSGRRSERRAADHHRRNLCLHALRPRAGGGRSRMTRSNRTSRPVIGAPDSEDPRGIAIQFRYAFVVDREGLKVLDVTDLDHPRMVPQCPGSTRRCAQHLRRAHLRLCRRRQAGTRHR